MGRARGRAGGTGSRGGEGAAWLGMVDVSGKFDTLREAEAEARVRASARTMRRVRTGRVPKGSIADIAAVAGVAAAKKTAELIPHCHPVPVDLVQVAVETGTAELVVRARVRAVWKTGVEIEALTAAAVAALAVVDILKFTKDEALALGSVTLLRKSGGHGEYRETFPGLRAGVAVVSTSTAAGRREDKSGRLISSRLKREGFAVSAYEVVPDDPGRIAEVVSRMADVRGLDLVVTTGGTGLSPEDVTIEAVRGLVDREVPGMAEAVRAYGRRRTPYAMLSRSLAGLRGKTLILALPGSSRGASESLDALFPGLVHAFPMVRRGGHPAKP